VLTWDPAFCGEVSGGWKPTAGDSAARLAAGERPVYFVRAQNGTDPQNGPLAFVGSLDAGLSTDAGVSIGSTFAELTAAYPGGFSRTDKKANSTVYAVDTAGGTLTYEVPAAGFGSDGTVTVMYQRPAGSELVHVWNSDAGYTCTG
jgi:hypothetical protein